MATSINWHSPRRVLARTVRMRASSRSTPHQVGKGVSIAVMTTPSRTTHALDGAQPRHLTCPRLPRRCPPRRRAAAWTHPRHAGSRRCHGLRALPGSATETWRCFVMPWVRRTLTPRGRRARPCPRNRAPTPSAAAANTNDPPAAGPRRPSATDRHPDLRRVARPMATCFLSKPFVDQFAQRHADVDPLVVGADAPLAVAQFARALGLNWVTAYSARMTWN
jgi:hypothetical protein